MPRIVKGGIDSPAPHNSHTPLPAIHRTFGMMKLLDRYILTRFLTVFAGALLVFITVFTVADLVERVDTTTLTSS